MPLLVPSIPHRPKCRADPLRSAWWAGDLASIACSTYLPNKNANKLLAAGLVTANITCATKKITIKAAAVNAIDVLRLIGVVR